jgi:hypothetical protein
LIFHHIPPKLVVSLFASDSKISLRRIIVNFEDKKCDSGQSFTELTAMQKAAKNDTVSRREKKVCGNIDNALQIA